MTMELSTVRVVRKPWGRSNLRPWSELGHDGSPIGELWFQRNDKDALESDLLLKLLFTDEPLSIQVHPDDAFAEYVGLAHGKTEAWYVLSAEQNSQIALGLKRELTRPQLRAAIQDGSVAELVHWRPVLAGETVLVPAGTIHALGAGLVIAEIQQRSDATFRLFDHGRLRALHIDGAVGSSITEPYTLQPAQTLALSDSRNVLTQSEHFVLEQIDLAPNSHWAIDAVTETWVLLLEGDAEFEQVQVASGEALFLEDHRATMRTGSRGAKGLMAYVASSPVAELLLGRNGIPMQVMAQRFPELGLEYKVQTAPATTGRKTS